jgi:hypothetical protein
MLFQDITYCISEIYYQFAIKVRKLIQAYV